MEDYGSVSGRFEVCLDGWVSCWISLSETVAR